MVYYILFTCFILSFLNIFTTIRAVPIKKVPTFYKQQRAKILTDEKKMGIGETLPLTREEKMVDAFIKNEKSRLIENSRLRGAHFPAADSFLNLRSRAEIEKTVSFSIIKAMPKGGLLHVHDTAITTVNWLVKNVTYRDNCYMCVNNASKVKFYFFSSLPSKSDCVWKSLVELRKSTVDVQSFDESLYDNISLKIIGHPDIDEIWSKFMDYFNAVNGLILFAPVFPDYIRQALSEIQDDGIQYVEIRALLSKVYDLNGNFHDTEWVLNQYRKVFEEFTEHNHLFVGGRIIKTSLRNKPSLLMLEDVKEAIQLFKKNADFLVGFDLVGQEDPTHTLIYYINDLLYPTSHTPSVNLPYFFHAGETNWQNTASDLNLVDAVLLNSTRIGHGYALYKHPLVMQLIKERDIAIEVNPISNQVLGLVSDLRNHPVASLIAQNFPLVISSDDPAVWGALPLTHDFYMAFMVLSGEDSGLGMLKQLALNSLKYSALRDEQKTAAIMKWQKKWDNFILNITCTFLIYPGEGTSESYTEIYTCPKGKWTPDSKSSMTIATQEAVFLLLVITTSVLLLLTV